jgi:hypothetical protein
MLAYPPAPRLIQTDQFCPVHCAEAFDCRRYFGIFFLPWQIRQVATQR